MFQKILKRLLDILIATLVLCVAFPVVATTAFLLRLTLRESPFFTQVRPGLGERPFRLFKLKTMRTRFDESGKLLCDEQRMTWIGSLVRKLSLDELPQLINVIKGEMSLVGPRPLLMEYLPLYNSRQRKRHLVKPGITGLAQVSGRNLLEWEKRLELDVQYVERWSLFLDLKILVSTVFFVVTQRGVSHRNHVTMQKFEGNHGQV